MSKFGLIYWKIALAITIIIMTSMYVISLRRDVQELQGNEKESVEIIKSIEDGHNLAVKIMSKSVWYIVDEETISSELDGCGEVIKLDKKLMTARSRMSIKYPEKNKEIYFFFRPEYDARHHEGSYTVASGFLWYVY